MLIPIENRRFQGLFKIFQYFSRASEAYLIFKDFSRKPSKFKYFSSLCELCEGTIKVYGLLKWQGLVSSADIVQATGEGLINPAVLPRGSSYTLILSKTYVSVAFSTLNEDSFTMLLNLKPIYSLLANKA